MTRGEIAPTIASSSAISLVSEDMHSDVSRHNVGFVVGSRPKFADETAELLRSRLGAATLVLTVTLSAAFAGNLMMGVTSLWWLRTATLTVLAICCFGLRSKRPFTLFQLRGVELVVFGIVMFQVALLLVTRIEGFSREQDVTSVIALKYVYLGAWSLLILVYGIFMPNTWKRGAMVMVPVALVPYIVLALHGWWSPEVAKLLATEKSLSPIPLPLVAALVGVYGTYIINAARREAFRARQFGQYQLQERLGSGGMGEVYKAEHVLLKRPCAMKLIRPGSDADAKAIARFETEVKATSKLTHWNTVEIYDYGHTEDGTFYYVMELLPGLSLEELVERHGPLPAGRVVHLLHQVCGALHEAHAVGLIHRDIKPANIYAAQRGGVFDVAKLLDFGLVKEATPQSSQVTDVNHGSFSGTPMYMAPEQASAYERVDGRADLYAVGAVAYYLLTGKPPFSGANVIQLLNAHANDEVVRPSKRNLEVPSDLEEVVLCCLEKQPEDRFVDALSLAKALTACQCAGDWTDELAAAWWQDQATTRSASDTDKSPIAATIDSKSGDPTAE